MASRFFPGTARALALAVAMLLLVPVIAVIFSPKPDLLAEVPFGAIVLDSDNRILKIGLSPDQKYRLRVSLDEIAPEAVDALLNYEDRYFFQHPGVNPVAVLRALASLAGERRLGASTITMQVARLRGKLKTRTFLGKIRQVWQALVLERHYSKREILTAYLNLAPYGGNIEGIEAAARIYFNKPASALTSLESRSLAIIPQNPVARNPVGGAHFNLARQRLETSQISSAASTIPPLQIHKPARLPFLAPHLCMELLGAKSGEERIQTWISRDLQMMLEQNLKTFTRHGSRYGIRNAAALILDCRDMKAVALAGSANFHDKAISGQVDGTRARRSPGSTLKPFIYALALEEGLIHPMTMLADSPRSFGGYDPGNFDKGFRGPIPAHEALKASRNLPAIILTEKLRQPGLYGFLRQAGVDLENGPEHYGLSLVLGGAEVSMRELATLYAMLANRGIWRPASFHSGEALNPPARLLSPESAHLALAMLERDDAYIYSRGAKIPLLYKTGTSNGFRDAWTAGVIGQYVLIVWVGNFDNRANPHFVGASVALPLFQDIAVALGGKRVLSNPLNATGLNLEIARVCVSTGDLDNGHCGETVESPIVPGVSPIRDSGVLRPILVDKATGLRACVPKAAETEEIWWEFWPTDMRGIFAKAGIYKPDPPAWLPGCVPETSQGKPPRIILPKKNLAYHRALANSGFALPLQAASDPDVKTIHWFAGASYLGSAPPGEVFLWKTERVGAVEILAVDDKGASARVTCRIAILQ